MRMHTDDEMYAVDDVFLGPSQQPLPWRARYRAYGIWIALYGLVLVVEIATETIGFWPAVYGLLASIWATMQIMDRVDHERTAKAVFVTFWHEVSAPRGDRTHRPAGARLTLSRVRRRPRRA